MAKLLWFACAVMAATLPAASEVGKSDVAEAHTTTVTITSKAVQAGSTTVAVVDITGIHSGNAFTLTDGRISGTKTVITVAADSAQRLATAGFVTVDSAFAHTYPPGALVTVSQSNYSTKEEGEGDDNNLLPTPAPAACAAAGMDRWIFVIHGCCSGLEECDEPRPSDDPFYCATNNTSHGHTCWSTITICRDRCSAAFPPTSNPPSLQHLYPALGGEAVSRTNFSEKVEGVGDDNNMLPTPASAACAAAGMDRWIFIIQGCCSGLEACVEPRPTDNPVYCASNNTSHGHTCWSTITICRDRCTKKGEGEGDGDDHSVLPTPAPAACAAAGMDRWIFVIQGCCSGLEACVEPRPSDNPVYCATNNTSHGHTCWSTITICRDRCSVAFPRTPTPPLQPHSYTALGGQTNQLFGKKGGKGGKQGVISQTNFSEKREGEGDDNNMLPMPALVACAAAGIDRWSFYLQGCCSGLEECDEPRPTDDKFYCATNNTRHGHTCWSFITVCRDHCAVTFPPTPPPPLQPHSYAALGGEFSVAIVEGTGIKSKNGLSLDACKQLCDASSTCRSLAHCDWGDGSGCHLKDKHFSGTEATAFNEVCTTYYRRPATLAPPTLAPLTSQEVPSGARGNTTTTPAPPTLAPSTSPEVPSGARDDTMTMPALPALAPSTSPEIPSGAEGNTISQTDGGISLQKNKELQACSNFACPQYYVLKADASSIEGDDQSVCCEPLSSAEEVTPDSGGMSTIIVAVVGGGFFVICVLFALIARKISRSRRNFLSNNVTNVLEDRSVNDFTLNMEIHSQFERANPHNTISPSDWCVTPSQFFAFHDEAEKRLTMAGIKEATSHDVVEHVVKPATAFYDCSYALMQNPKGSPGMLYVVHAWAGAFSELVCCLRDGFEGGVDRDDEGLWISLLAIPQTWDANRLSSLVGTRIYSSPFYIALSSLPLVLAVRSSGANMYSRLWCVFELWAAHKTGKMVITLGYNENVSPDLANIGCQGSCTNPSDTDLLRLCLSRAEDAVNAHMSKIMQAKAESGSFLARVSGDLKTTFRSQLKRQTTPLPDGKKYHYFMSHKKHHSELGNVSASLALSMHDALSSQGFSGFFDVDHLENISQRELEDAVKNSCSVLVCLTDETCQSEWCRFEWDIARRYNIPVKGIVDIQNFHKPKIITQVQTRNSHLLKYQLSEYTDRTRKAVTTEIATWLGKRLEDIASGENASTMDILAHVDSADAVVVEQVFEGTDSDESEYNLYMMV